MIAQTLASLEGTMDALKSMLLGPEFDKALREEHAQQARPLKWGMRVPERVYTDEKDNPDAFPFAELIAVREDDDQNSTIAQLTCEISCQWTVNGDDTEEMARELRRFVSATRSAFRNCGSIAGIPGKFRTGNADYSPATRIANNVQPYAKSASIEIFWNVSIR